MPKKGKRAAQKARAQDEAGGKPGKPKKQGDPGALSDEENPDEGTVDVKSKANGASKSGKEKEKEKEKPSKGKGKKGEDADKPKGKRPAQFTDIMAEATSAGTSEFTIKADDFSLGFQGKSLLENTNLTIAFGRRYGLVGINGSGKSTLIRAIAKGEIPGIPKNIQILHVEQEVEGDERTPVQSVIEADTERLSLLKEQQDLEDFLKNVKDDADEEWSEEKDEEIAKKRERVQEVYGRLAQIGAHSAESRASAILTGLQFTERMKSSPTKELSGGWRMRIALARALFCRPHLLLLDEPTNHLDLFACIWFETFLSKWKKSLLIVSHDIDMLNTVCTDIIYLNHGQKSLEQYRGNYDHFLEKREEKRAKQEKDYDKQQKEIKRLRKQAQAVKTGNTQKVKPGGKKERGAGAGRESRQGAAKGAKSAAEELEELLKNPLPAPDREYRVSFNFPEPGSLPHPVLQVKDVSFSYAGRDENEKPHVIFDNINLGIGLDTRIALVGPNGAGKSTLLNLLTGNLEPTVGEVVISRKLKMARFNQHTHEQLDLDKTPCELLMSLHPGMKLDEARKHLGRVGVTGKTQLNKIETLSGGQRSRVVFAILALDEPHILMMDEPTNNLDIESIEALCKALREFKGGVVLVTHDQNLIAQGCNRIWCIDGDQKVHEFPGDFHEYQKRLVAKLDFSELEEIM